MLLASKYGLYFAVWCFSWGCSGDGLGVVARRRRRGGSVGHGDTLRACRVGAAFLELRSRSAVLGVRCGLGFRHYGGLTAGLYWLLLACVALLPLPRHDGRGDDGEASRKDAEATGSRGLGLESPLESLHGFGVSCPLRLPVVEESFGEDLQTVGTCGEHFGACPIVGDEFRLGGRRLVPYVNEYTACAVGRGWVLVLGEPPLQLPYRYAKDGGRLGFESQRSGRFRGSCRCGHAETIGRVGLLP